MKRFFLLLCLLLSASLSQAAVTFDATSSGSGASTAVSFSHTVTTGGSNRAIFFCVEWSGTGTLSVPQYAGASATTIFAIVGGTIVSNSCFVKINPATGANNVTATLSSSTNWKAGALSATSVHQTTPNGTAVTDTTGGNGAISINISSASTELVMDSLALDLSGGVLDPAVGAGQTQNWMLTQIITYAGASSRETGASTTTMSWTAVNRGGGTKWAFGAFAIKEASNSAVPTIVFTGD